MSTIRNNAIVLTASKTVSALASFLGGIILTRALSVSDYATYSQVVLIGSTTSICSIGLSQSLFYFIPLTKESDRKGLLLRTIFINIIVFFLFSLIILFFDDNLANMLNNDRLVGMMVPLVMFMVLFGMSEYIDALLVSYGRVVSLAVTRIAMSILILLSIIIPITLSFGIEVIISFVAMSYGLSLIVYLVFILRIKTRIFCGNTFHLHHMANQLKYALPIMASSVIGIIGKRLDQYLIATMFAIEEYAIYSRGATNIPLIDILTASVFTVLLPEFVKLINNDDHGSVRTMWNNAVHRIALVLIPTSVFFAVMAEPFVVLLFSDKYTDSAAVFRIYSLILMVKIAIYGVIPRAVGRTKLIYKVVAITAISNIIFSYPLILLLGPIGAAVGTLLSSCTGAWFALTINASLLKCPFSMIMPWNNLVKILVVSLISALCLLVIATFVDSELLVLLLGILFYVPLVAAMYFYFSLIDKGDVQYFKRFIFRSQKILL